MHAFRANPAARTIAPLSRYTESEAHRRRQTGDNHRLDLIERHMRETGLSASRVGRIIANDSRLVFDLREGRQIGVHVAGRVDSYFGGFYRGRSANA